MKIKSLISLSTLLFIFSCSTSPGNKKASDAKWDPPHSQDSLFVLSAVGMRQVMLDLIPKFEQTTGIHVSISFNSSGEIVNMINDGKAGDVVIITRPDVERLITTEKVMLNTRTNIAMSHVGIAVLKDAAKPDMSTPEKFKKAMLDAKSIACPDPKLGGSSGKHIAKMFEQLGIADEVSSKLVLSSTPDNEKSMPGYLVATGKAEIALHQMQELLAVPGIDIVGPLPGELQATFVFTATVLNNTKQMNAAKSLIQFLSSPEAKVMIKMKGMEPAVH